MESERIEKERDIEKREIKGERGGVATEKAADKGVKRDGKRRMRGREEMG